jgi:hypothetical protein
MMMNCYARARVKETSSDGHAHAVVVHATVVGHSAPHTPTITHTITHT